MHNLVLAGNPTDAQHVSNIEVISRSIDHEIYTYHFNPEMLSEGGFASAAAYVAGSSTEPSYWELADGVTSGVKGFVRRHHEWRDGFFSVNLYWSSDAANNEVVFSVCVDPIVPSTAFATSAASFTVSATSSATGMKTNTLSSATLAAASRVNAQHLGVLLTVSRLGADAADRNTGTARIYGVEIVYHEARTMVGGGVSNQGL